MHFFFNVITGSEENVCICLKILCAKFRVSKSKIHRPSSSEVYHRNSIAIISKKGHFLSRMRWGIRLQFTAKFNYSKLNAGRILIFSGWIVMVTRYV